MVMAMNRRKSTLLAAAALLVLVPLSACTAQSGAGSGGDSSGVEVAPALPDTAIGEGAIDAGGSFDEASGMMASQGDRSIMRSGDISLTVGDVKGAVDRVAKIAIGLNGSVETQSENQASGDLPAGADLSIRVPVDKIDEAFAQLSKVGTVVSQGRSATDVTTEHVDLEARVDALETSIDRLTKLMDEATSTSDLIEAETALSTRQQELDGLRAQLKWLETQVDEANIWVTLASPSVLPGGPDSFWDGVIAGFNSIGAAAAGGLVVLGILLPWLLLAAVIVGAVIWAVRAGNKRRARRGLASSRAREAAAAEARATSSASPAATQATPTPATQATATDAAPGTTGAPGSGNSHTAL